MKAKLEVSPKKYIPRRDKKYANTNSERIQEQSNQNIQQKTVGLIEQPKSRECFKYKGKKSSNVTGNQVQIQVIEEMAVLQMRKVEKTDR